MGQWYGTFCLLLSGYYNTFTIKKKCIVFRMEINNFNANIFNKNINFNANIFNKNIWIKSKHYERLDVWCGAFCCTLRRLVGHLIQGYHTKMHPLVESCLNVYETPHSWQTSNHRNQGNNPLILWDGVLVRHQHQIFASIETKNMFWCDIKPLRIIWLSTMTNYI